MLKKGKNKLPEPITYGLAESDLGPVLVASSAKGVVSILIGWESKKLVADFRRRFPHAAVSPGTTKDERLARKVAGHIEKPKGDLDIALDLRGTPFQQKVWKALLTIPAGKTSSYRDIVRKSGCPRV